MADERREFKLPQPGAKPDEAEAPATPQHFEAAAEPKATGKVYEADVVEALKSVYDPEIPVNIHDLGLIYGIEIDPQHNDVRVKMTLTTPNCPEAQNIPLQVQEAVRQYSPAARRVAVDIVWEPRWTKDMMSEDAKLALDMF